MYAVDVRESGSELSLGQPKRLFTSGFMEAPSLTIANYDVSIDGQRFLAVRGTAGQVRPSLVLNWSKELDELTGR